MKYSYLCIKFWNLELTALHSNAISLTGWCDIVCKKECKKTEVILPRSFYTPFGVWFFLYKIV